MAEKIALPRARHEVRDIGGRFIVVAFLLLFVSLGAMGLLGWLLFPRATNDKMIADPLPPFPAPQLQPDPHQDWERFHAAELQRLNGYGWVNKTAGIAHIPVGKAMQETARRGIPSWPVAEGQK